MMKKKKIVANTPEEFKQLTKELKLVEKKRQEQSVAIANLIKENSELKSMTHVNSEQEIKQHELNEKRLNFALEGSGQGVWDWNMITGEAYFSSRWKEMLGYKGDEIKNEFREWEKRVHPDDLLAAKKEIKKALTHKDHTYFMEFRMRCKDGTYKWIRSKGKVLEWLKNGNPSRMVGTHMDISDVKAHEDALLQSEEKFRSVVENSPVIIMTADLNENITFINFSGGARDVEQIIGKTLYNFVLPEYHEMVRKAHRNVIENHVVESYETETIDLNGDRLWFQTQVAPIKTKGKVVGITLFALNITHRKAAEEKVIQSLKEKEVLLKEVHHRVKNNMQIISSILNLQAHKTTNKKTLAIIHDSQQRIKSMSIIHELLYQSNDFSRINFTSYIKNILSNLVASYSKQTNISLQLDLDAVFLDLDSSIPCGLIINELVTNALKYAFTPLEKGILKIILKQKKDLITLKIADNGKGLPADIDYKHTKSLGMQLVITLTEQLGGEIELDNNHGAAYTIAFKQHSHK